MPEPKPVSDDALARAFLAFFDLPSVKAQLAERRALYFRPHPFISGLKRAGAFAAADTDGDTHV